MPLPPGYVAMAGFAERRIAAVEMPETGQSAQNFGSELARASILVIDDEPGMRNFLSKVLTGNCAAVHVAEDTQHASRLLDEHTYDVIVLDNIMPEKTGLEWLAEQRRIGLFSDAILITAHADLDAAITAIRAGASDFLLKPFRSNQILNALARSLERKRLQRQNSVLKNELELGNDVLKYRDALLGSSAEIHAVRTAIDRAAATQSHIVIRGEVGCGKQVAARMLHAASQRSDNSFVWLQCYGMTEEGFQEKLFGQVNQPGPQQFGASEHGMLMNAAGGTLFLEDVEMLSPGCQNILSELLTTGRFTPLGASRGIDLDVRIISSTTRPLKQIADEHAFRIDLFYLLTIVEIVLPPLRERTEDIVELTGFLSGVMAKRMGTDVPEFTSLARRRFLSHDWPGNVMELRNTVERALIHGDFETALGSHGGAFELESLAAVEQRHILAVLEACNGNRAEAARHLGVARKTIDRKCQAWDL